MTDCQIEQVEECEHSITASTQRCIDAAEALRVAHDEHTHVVSVYETRALVAMLDFARRMKRWRDQIAQKAKLGGASE